CTRGKGFLLYYFDYW
nr:immunoglobulin heavy chain junction region [Macaca mulatta]